MSAERAPRAAPERARSDASAATVIIPESWLSSAVAQTHEQVRRHVDAATAAAASSPPLYYSLPGVVPFHCGRSVGPPPSYDDVTNPFAAPPSYQSLYGQMREASKSSRNMLDLLRRLLLILASTLGCSLLIASMILIPFTMIIVGAVYLGDCRIEHIPAFLLMGGLVWASKNVLHCYSQCRKQSAAERLAELDELYASTPASSGATGAHRHRPAASAFSEAATQTPPQPPPPLPPQQQQQQPQQQQPQQPPQAVPTPTSNNNNNNNNTSATQTTSASSASHSANNNDQQAQLLQAPGQLDGHHLELGALPEARQLSALVAPEVGGEPRRERPPAGARRARLVGAGPLADRRRLKSSICESLLNCVLLGWFIAGCTIVLRNLEPEFDDTSSPKYCHRTVYLYTFWLITSAVLLVGLFVCAVCCLMVGSAVAGRYELELDHEPSVGEDESDELNEHERATL